MDATSKLVVIVPYRDRQVNLQRFVPALRAHLEFHHPTLEYELIVVEQPAGGAFNKGRLMNAGFLLREHQDCYFCFHDVDMLPEDASCDYSLPSAPVAMARLLSQRGYRPRGENYCGGVTLFTKQDFRTINGFSNGYWGWGYEDDDVRNRVKAFGLAMDYSRAGRYTVLPHALDPQFGPRTSARQQNRKRISTPYRYEDDGISSLSFHIASQSRSPEYTWYLVEAGRQHPEERAPATAALPQLAVPPAAPPPERRPQFNLRCRRAWL